MLEDVDVAPLVTVGGSHEADSAVSRTQLHVRQQTVRDLKHAEEDREG